MNSNLKQVGGDHYKKMPLQPWWLIRECGLDFWQGNVVKYVSRYKEKNGKEDLEKAIHCLEYLNGNNIVNEISDIRIVEHYNTQNHLSKEQGEAILATATCHYDGAIFNINQIIGKEYTK